MKMHLCGAGQAPVELIFNQGLIYQLAHRRASNPNLSTFRLYGKSAFILLNRILDQGIDSDYREILLRDRIGDSAVSLLYTEFLGIPIFDLHCDSWAAWQIEETLVANGTDLGLTKMSSVHFPFSL